MGSTFERTQVELVSGWLIVGAKQGKKEPFDRLLRTGNAPRTLCADEFGLRHVQTGSESVICFAIADGVGNEPHADLGASEAVKEAINSLANECRFDDIGKFELQRVLASVHRRLISVAEQRKVIPSNLATTLLVGALHIQSSKLACASVGDAFVVAQTDEHAWSFPPLDSFEPNAGTYSIIDDNWDRVARYGECPFSAATIIAFTDGLRHVMFKVDRAGPLQITTPHTEAIQMFRQAIMHSENASRGRVVSALLGVSDDRKLMEDDRTVLVLQSLSRAPLATFPPAQQETIKLAVAPTTQSPQYSTPERELSEPVPAPHVAVVSRLSRRPSSVFGTVDRKLSLVIAFNAVTLLVLLLSLAVDASSMRQRVVSALKRSTDQTTPASTAAPAPVSAPAQNLDNSKH